MHLENSSFMIEVVLDAASSRIILRDWTEIEGYAELAYQEWESMGWVDKQVLPAMNREDLTRLVSALTIALENFIENPVPTSKPLDY